ncbi:MAG: alpha/beta hydrolase [Pseudomonadota bacterium]
MVDSSSKAAGPSLFYRLTANANTLLKLLIWTTIFAGLLLLSGAAFTAARTSRAEAAHPPVGAFMQQPGVRLHYRVTGPATPGKPALFLLHGATTNLNDFFSLTDRLSASLQVVAVDRPGAGYSHQTGTQWMNPAAQAQAILALQLELGIPRAVWAGHSLAGSVVMAGLLDAPEQVVGGVMLAGAAYPWDGGVDWINHVPGVPVLGPLVTHSLIAPAGSLRLDSGIINGFAPDPVIPSYRERSGIDLYLRPGHFAATARDIRQLSEYLVEPSRRYGEITQPVLLVHGDADTIVPAWNHADRLVEVLPAVTYQRLPGTGHQPHHVHADRVAGWIETFIDEQASGVVQ